MPTSEGHGYSEAARRKVELHESETITGERDEVTATPSLPGEYERALPSHYRLIQLIGHGGMAEVFLARDERLGRNVAIKFLNAEFRRDPERMRRFKQEARAASALEHPNILVIHDIGERDGVQFIVSEYVDGESLSSRISRGKIPMAEAAEIAIQIASALSASHKAGIIHRDIKPDNVMLRRDGGVKVLDFGLAKDTGEHLTGLDANTLAKISTSPGLILGTPQYMSPEQARGLRLDGRADIFSLGVTLFEMVTGRLPFTGHTVADIIAALISKEPRPLDEDIKDPPATLVSSIDKALRKDREERYASIDEMAADLRTLRQELSEAPPRAYRRETDGREAITAVLPGSVRTVAERFGNRPVIFATLIGLVVVGAAAWWYTGGLRFGPGSGPDRSSMRTIPIMGWSSNAGELVSAASFSPNASMVAFAATRSGATEIWVKPVTGGDPIQVTKNNFYNMYPIWSPDGQDLAYLSNRGDNRGIWRVSFTGGEQRLITSGFRDTARLIFWTKDGKIYFQEGSEVFTVDAESGERSQVTDFGTKGEKPWTVQISHDGAAVAYTIKENDLWRLKVKRLDSEAAKEVASSKEQIDNIVWYPSGSEIAYSSSVDGVYQVFEVPATGGRAVQLSTSSADCSVSDVSGDGSKLLYSSVNETSDLWGVDTKDSRQYAVANDVTAEYWPDVSPDGKNVVYQSVQQVNRAFSGVIKVTSPTGLAVSISPQGFSPAWSKDGRRIAFFRRTESGIEIWSIKPTGDDAVKIAGGGIEVPEYLATPYLKKGTHHLSWSPDSGSVAYSAKTQGVSNIWVAAADGSRNAPLTSNQNPAESYCCPVWSPDQKLIVFASKMTMSGPPPQMIYRIWVYQVENSEQRSIFESKQQLRLLGMDESAKDVLIARSTDGTVSAAVPDTIEMYMLSLQSGAQTKINTLSNAYFNNIQLSPDGKSIAFVSRQDDITALWTVPVNGGAPKRLLVENDPKVLFSTLAWAPDGRSIVFGKQTRTNLLSLLTK